MFVDGMILDSKLVITRSKLDIHTVLTFQLKGLTLLLFAAPYSGPPNTVLANSSATNMTDTYVRESTSSVEPDVEYHDCIDAQSYLSYTESDFDQWAYIDEIPIETMLRIKRSKLERAHSRVLNLARLYAFYIVTPYLIDLFVQYYWRDFERWLISLNSIDESNFAVKKLQDRLPEVDITILRNLLNRHFSAYDWMDNPIYQKNFIDASRPILYPKSWEFGNLMATMQCALDKVTIFKPINYHI